MANISKRQKANIAKVDRTKVYSATEAIDLVKQTANTKFKGTVEVHVRLGIDPK